MPFLFTNALFLSALAGLGIPVVLHLLLKRKSQRLRFSTVRFFVRQDEQASSKRKLRNLLLLALRLLLFALLVLAFARPYLPSSTLAGGGRSARQLVLVLDQSASLQAVDSGGSRWPRAQKAARDLLSALRSDDRAALVTCGGQVTIVSGFAPASVVAQKLTKLLPGTGGGDLTDGLREAARLVTLGDPRLTTSITVISDLQKASAPNLGAVPLPTDLEVTVVPVGDLAAPNIAVAELNLEPANDISPHATIVSYGDEDLPALKTEFRIDGKVVLNQALPLVAGGATNLNLTLPVMKPGWHNAEFLVQSKDGLSLDDLRYQTFFIPEPVHVLLVEGRSGVRSFAEQTFFLSAALDPARGTTNPPSTRFTVRKILPEDLAKSLTDRSAVPRPEVVLLPAIKQLSAEATQALHEFVNRGGGLLLFVGEETVPGRYHSDFGELSPVVLRATETANGDFGWRLGEHDQGSVFFAPFRGPNSGNLALATFTRRFNVVSANQSTVWARFDDNVPFLVGGKVGTGRVVWANTSSDTSWNDWPKHKTFVPWLHQTVVYLSGREAADQLRAGANCVAGVESDLELGPEAKLTTFRLQGPAEKEVALTADDQGRLTANLSQPGIYSLQTANGRELRRLAVNVPTSESDLIAWRTGEFQQRINRVIEHETTGLGSGLFASSRNQREFWRVLLVAALVLLYVETLFSNRSLA